jgi:diguanylate cyclase (GGDEF)-like protein
MVWLDTLKRRVYLIAFSLVTISTAVGSSLGDSNTAIFVIFGPVVAICALTLTVIVWRRLLPLRVVEVTAYAMAATLLLTRVAFELFAPSSGAALGSAFAAFAPWIAGVMVLAFVMLDTRTALVGAVGLYAAMLATAGIYLGVNGVGGVSRAELNALVQQFVVANAFYIALLYLMARVKEEYAVAEYRSRAMTDLAHTDELTQIPNRRHITAACAKEVERLERSLRPFSVIIFDIDHFKTVNDTHGHNVGDVVLRRVSRAVSGALRAGDEVGRIGGEEFVVLAYDADSDTAVGVADRLRQTVENDSAPHTPAVTASFGVAGYCPGDSVETLLARADRALYIAKDSGRNCVVTAPGPRSRRSADPASTTTGPRSTYGPEAAPARER